MTGDLYVGMSGPGAVIAIEVTAPSAFSGSFSAATRTLEAEVTQADGTVAAFSSFTWTDLTASGGTANYVPDGTEFTYAGTGTLAMRLTLNGTAYDLKSQTVHVKTIALVRP